MSIGITDLIAGIFKPAADLVDELHTSKEEKLNAKAKLLEVQAAAMDTCFDYEKETFKARANIIAKEAEHPIAGLWRPTLMLTFGALIVGRYLGYEAEAMSPEEYIEMWGLLKVGIGGYIAARSTEKIVKTVKGAKDA